MEDTASSCNTNYALDSIAVCSSALDGTLTEPKSWYNYSIDKFIALDDVKIRSNQ